MYKGSIKGSIRGFRVSGFLLKGCIRVHLKGSIYGFGCLGNGVKKFGLTA